MKFQMASAEIIYPRNEESSIRLLRALEKFGMVLALHGIPVNLVSKRGLAKLEEIEPSKKHSMAEYIENWTTWIEPVRDVHGNTLPYDEKVTLRKALNHYDLEMHPDMWATIMPNHMLEVYGKEMLQIYRSLNFFTVCGYSLLDLMTHEWYVLWERPKIILDNLLATAQKYSTNYIPVSEFVVPRHLLREIWDTGLTEPFEPRATLVEFQFIGTLVDHETKKVSGFCCTSTGKVVAHGQDAVAIDFL